MMQTKIDISELEDAEDEEIAELVEMVRREEEDTTFG